MSYQNKTLNRSRRIHMPKIMNVAILPIFLLIFIILGIQLLINYRYSNKVIEEQVTYEYINIINNKRESINDMFDRILALINNAFYQDETLDLISGNVKGYDKMLANEKTGEYLLYDKGFGGEYDLFYYGDNGITYLKNDALFDSKIPFTQTDWYKDAVNDENVLHWFGLKSHEITLGNYNFVGSKKINISDYKRGELSGIAYFAIEEPILKNMLKDMGGSIYIIGKDGIILYNTDEKVQGQNIKDVLGIDNDKDVPKDSNYKVNVTETGFFKTSVSTVSIISPRDKYGFSFIHVRDQLSIMAKYKYLQVMSYAFFILVILAVIYYFILFILRISRPLQRLYSKVSQEDSQYKKSIGVFGNVNTVSTGFEHLDNEFNKIMLVNKENLLKINEIEKDEQLMEIKKLQAEIDPHFLYNILSHIKFYAMLDNPEQIMNIIDSLFAILNSKKSQVDHYIAVREEVEILKKYIYIINIIYDNNIDFTFNIDPSILDCEIPSFILQPIVENCIHHGMNPSQPGGKVSITGMENENGIYFMIADNGKGIQEEAIERIMQYQDDSYNKANEHMGIMNIDKKIKLCCGEGYGISIQSKTTKGTTVIINVKNNEILFN